MAEDVNAHERRNILRLCRVGQPRIRMRRSSTIQRVPTTCSCGSSYYASDSGFDSDVRLIGKAEHDDARELGWWVGEDV